MQFAGKYNQNSFSLATSQVPSQSVILLPCSSRSLSTVASGTKAPVILRRRRTPIGSVLLPAAKMSQGDNGSGKPDVSPYDEAMAALSSLITKRSRACKSNKGDRFDLLFEYLKVLELEEPVKQMKIIHVAGTKGKGSTCTFAEAILRNCGFHTGLFTSPHLIDVRERFRLDGVDICEERFLAYFWWCWDRLKENTSEEVPMPTYFRFLALLAFKIFAAEQVDVAILEVGLGGKFDATNVVETPIVCGIASLGYDHMEILGNTLGQIAGEKAGIFKRGVPAFTVPQPDEAMCVLEDRASELDVPLQVVSPLDPDLLSGLSLGLEGEHQFVNAGLAIALCSTWLHRTGNVGINYLKDTTNLPEQFIKGLTTAALQGRAQIVPDRLVESESPGDLVFYFDGAHSPESMDVCAKWFSLAIRQGHGQQKPLHDESHQPAQSDFHIISRKNSMQDLILILWSCILPGENLRRQIDATNNILVACLILPILLFNCMSVRDPQLLLSRLMNACANQGVYFQKALFVPNTSVYYKVGTSSVPPADTQVNLSWQLSLQRIWENLMCDLKGRDMKNVDLSLEEGIDGDNSLICEHSSVFPSIPLAVNWLRECIRRKKSVRFQVLVTGSLHLVGDVLRLVK